jgi:hypothetical protein
MSRRGVPSTISKSWICSIPFSTFTSRTTDIPIELGRAGARVANTPCNSLSRYGVTFSENVLQRWKWYIKIMWEKPSIPSSPSTYLGNISTVPWLPTAPADCIGVPRVSELRMYDSYWFVRYSVHYFASPESQSVHDAWSRHYRSVSLPYHLINPLGVLEYGD